MKRCVYCGHAMTWREHKHGQAWRNGVCRHCSDLPYLHAQANGEKLPPMRADLQATKGKVT